MAPAAAPLKATEVLAELQSGAPRARREVRVAAAGGSAARRGEVAEQQARAERARRTAQAAGVDACLLEAPTCIEGQWFDAKGREVAGGYAGAPLVPWRPPAGWAPPRVRDDPSAIVRDDRPSRAKCVFRVGGLLYDVRGRRVKDRLSGALLVNDDFEPPHGWVPRLDASLDAVMAEREQGGEQLRSKGRPRGGDSGLSLDDEVGMRLESELLALGGSGGAGPIGLVSPTSSPPKGRRVASAKVRARSRADGGGDGGGGGGGTATTRARLQKPQLSIVERKVQKKRMQDAWDAIG